MGEARDGLRLREDHAGPRSQRLRRRPTAEAADDQHSEARRHAQRRGGPLRRPRHDEGPHAGGGRSRGGRSARAGGGSRHRSGPFRPVEDADRAISGRSVVHPHARDRAARARRRHFRPNPHRARPLRQELSRLARRETRLAGEPATLVGPQNPDLARRGRGRGRSSEGVRGPEDRVVEDRWRQRLACLLVGRVARRRRRGGKTARPRS